MSTKKGRFWEKEWSLFELTSENRTSCIKNETELVEIERIKDYIVYTIGFGYGKGIKLKDINKEELVEEIYSKYILELEEGEESRNDIGYVLEFWTADFHRNWTGYFKFEDAKMLLLEEISKDNLNEDWMLMFIDIRQKLNEKAILELGWKRAIKVTKRKSGRPIILHEYIKDFRSFLRIRGRLITSKKKYQRDLEKSYLSYFNKDTSLIKNLSLRLGLYYIYKLGLRLKVLDKRFIRSRSRINRKIYSYSVNKRKWS